MGADTRFLAFVNGHRAAAPQAPSGLDVRGALEVHRHIPDYRATPLLSLPCLARELGVSSVLVKDESERFGLGAFKALGASHAVCRLLADLWRSSFGSSVSPGRFVGPADVEPLGGFTFATATDGNHGRAVAWTARRLGQQAEIFMPTGSALARIEAIRREDARVTIIDGPYDHAVDACRTEADAQGWTVVSDTSWPGYTTVPMWVAEGYLTLFVEVDEQRREAAHPSPDVLLVPGGVGTLAHAALEHIRHEHQSTAVVVVEPIEAACLLESARSRKGERRTASGRLETVMAGLNCGTPSLTAWPTIRSGAAAFVAVGDGWAEEALRRLADPSGTDPVVTAGESGAASLAGLLALLREPDGRHIRDRLALGPSSHVLLLATEGPTDPGSWSGIVGRDPELPFG